jgi:hypothetical protein
MFKVNWKWRSSSHFVYLLLILSTCNNTQHNILTESFLFLTHPKHLNLLFQLPFEHRQVFYIYIRIIVTWYRTLSHHANLTLFIKQSKNRLLSAYAFKHWMNDVSIVSLQLILFLFSLLEIILYFNSSSIQLLFNSNIQLTCILFLFREIVCALHWDIKKKQLNHAIYEK